MLTMVLIEFFVLNSTFFFSFWNNFYCSLTRLLPILCNRTETEYVSQMLTNVKRFAQHHACHVWFVAHPRQVGLL